MPKQFAKREINILRTRTGKKYLKMLLALFFLYPIFIWVVIYEIAVNKAHKGKRPFQ